MINPAQKRRAARSVVAAQRCTGRQACRYLGLGCSTWHYTAQPPTPRAVQLERAILELSPAHPRYGYRRVHAVLPRQGLECALRTVQRVRRCAGRQITGPAVRPKTALRPEAKIKSDGVNDLWCIDVVIDTTQHGTMVKFLTLLDEYSHYNLDFVASRRMGSREVVAALQAAVELHGPPRYLRCDNGSEFVAKDLQAWLRTAGITTRFIEPASPWQNGVNESFNGRFRDECLNRELLASVVEAQCVARTFRDDYNTSRPHSSINYCTPAEYRAELLRQAPDSGQARQAGPSLRRELAIIPKPQHSRRSNRRPAQSLITGGPRA
ncbi:MAG: IS3 family transposase [Opitutaceae bacterium]|nr:IS3 family transposase [Opitutaceae bacterium]MBP9914144.1 IS3 family transposase [Opitutaceae bacterium]